MKIVSHLFRCAFYSFSLLLLLFLTTDQADPRYQDYIGKKIIRIDFSGNQFKSSSDLLDLIYARPGVVLTKDIINQDVKKIYASGAFSDVRLIASNYKGGVKLEFIVQERSYINIIEFKGLGEIPEKDAKEAVLVEEGSIYDEKLISESIEILRAKYEEKGFFGATVRTRVEPDEDGNRLKLTFLSDEGEEIKITKISVLGTEMLDPEDIVDSMELEEDGFIADGAFNKNTFETDKEKVVSYMNEQGYLDAELIEAAWRIVWEDEQKETRGIEITLKVKEGEQYFFNGYDVEWNKENLNKDTQKPLYQAEQFYKLFEYTDGDVGDVYNDTRVRNDGNLINQLYSQEGYIFTRVQPEKTAIILNPRELEKWRNSPIQKKYQKEGVDYYHLKILEKILKKNPKIKNRKYIHTKFVIYEGDRGYIESILIKGNEKTQERVIRREILVTEGQLFNAALVQRSRENIFNLGFFKDVSLDIRPGSSERKLDLVIDVQEQPTGNISLGGGYGTQAGFTIFTELAENNLNGTGQRIAGKLDLGPNRFLVDSSWREPWLFNKPWSLSLGLSYTNQTFTQGVSIIENRPASYKEEFFSFRTQLGHRFAVFWGHYHGWTPSINRYHSPSSLANELIYTLVNQGWRFTNKVFNGIYYDDRDNFFNTTSGMRAQFQWIVAGNFLAGNSHFMQYEPSYRFYWWPFDFTFFGLFRKPILRRWRVVLEHRFSLGFTQITGPVYGDQIRSENPYIRINDRYYLGGYESLRGWLPNDLDYPLSWRNRGSHRMLFGSELRIPLEPSIIWFVLFFEGGALFQDVDNILLDVPTRDIDEIQSIRDTGLTRRNFRGDYFKYSWGFGFRIQIPILPLRFYFSKKVIWDPNLNFFRELPGEGFQFNLGIGDQRF